MVTKLLKYKTNPLNPDTDGDGLSDSEEVLTHKTNPLMIDTDAGTVDDGTEVKRGTDPLNAEDDVVKIGVPFMYWKVFTLMLTKQQLNLSQKIR